MSKSSSAWNRERFAGAVKLGVPGAGPSPVIVSVRTADHGESINPIAPPTSCDALTRQKYVPLDRPLSRAKVGIGSPLRTAVNPAAKTPVKVFGGAACPEVPPNGPAGTH